MNRIQAQTSRKIREAMSGLRAAMKTASPAKRKEIRAAMSELRDIKSEIRAMEEDEMMLDSEESPEEEMMEEGMEDMLGDDDMDMLDEEPMDMLGDDDMDDEELALSSLDLAAAALRAAAEEEEEEDEPADEEDSEEDSEEDDSEEDESAEEDDSEEDDDSEDGDDVDGSGDDDDDDDDEGDMETLSEDELAALEKEGLLEGSARRRISSRLSRVQKRLSRLIATDVEMDFGSEGPSDLEPEVDTDAPDALEMAPESIDDEEMPEDYIEDAEASEYLSVAQVRELLASMSPKERRDFVTDNRTVSAKKRPKMSKSARAKAKRRATINRKRRRFRTEMKKSKKGMRGSVNTPKGRKKVRKKFYFNTYDSKGKFLGSYWFTSNRPSPQSRKAYKEKYGMKHPADLAKLDDRRLASMKEKRAPKKKKSPAKK